MAWSENALIESISNSVEQTSRSRKIALPSNHSLCFLKLSKWNFRLISRYIEKYIKEQFTAELFYGNFKMFGFGRSNVSSTKYPVVTSQMKNNY